MSEYIVYVREIIVHTVLVDVPEFNSAATAPKLALDTIRTESTSLGLTSRFETSGMHKYNPHEDVEQYEFSPGWPRRYPIIR